MFKSTILAVFLCLAFSLTAVAQDHSRNWSNGTVWTVSNVHINDGMFNAYINDLNANYRKFMDGLKAEGDVVSYQMFSNAFARQGEPDLFLVVEYANWAAFDRSQDSTEEMAAKIFGSNEASRTANIDRGELREIGSTMVMQEISFGK